MFRTPKTTPPGEDKNSQGKDLKDRSQANDKNPSGPPPPDAPPSNRASRAPKAPAPRSKAFRGKFISAPGRSQRRAARMGLLLIVGIAGISGGVLVLHRSNIMTTVYFAQRSIPSGAVIQPSDVAAESIASPGIRNALPLSEIVGQTATESILHGEVLTSGLTTQNSLGSSEVVLGVSLAQGHLPVSGLAPGTRVEVIDTSPTTSTGASSDPVLAQAMVSSVVPGSNGSGTLVDLILPSSAAPAVAVAAASTAIALARES